MKQKNFSHPAFSHPVSCSEVIAILSFFLSLVWRLFSVGGSGGVFFLLYFYCVILGHGCGRQNNGPSPTSVYSVNPRTCADGKRIFKDMMKLRVLRWGGCAGLPGWARCNHKGLDKRGQERQKQRSEWCGPLRQGKRVASRRLSLRACRWSAALPTQFSLPLPSPWKCKMTCVYVSSTVFDGRDTEMKILSPPLQVLWGGWAFELTAVTATIITDLVLQFLNFLVSRSVTVKNDQGPQKALVVWGGLSLLY